MVGSPHLYGADVAGGLINRHCAGSRHLYGADLGPIPRAQKQKIGLYCNFFAIRDCCRVPNRGLGRKNAGNRLCGGSFSLRGNEKESAIAKKLQRSQDFCFSHCADCCNRANHAKNARNLQRGQWGNRVKEERRQGRTLICVCSWQGRQSLDPCSKKPVSR